jgi:hypothetical protein
MNEVPSDLDGGEGGDSIGAGDNAARLGVAQLTSRL